MIGLLHYNLSTLGSKCDLSTQVSPLDCWSVSAPQSTYICSVQSCVWRLPKYSPPPPPPSPPSECVLPPHQRRGLHTRRAVRGMGVNILEDAKHVIGLLQYNLSTLGSKCDLSTQISPLDCWSVSALSIPIGGNGTIPLLTLTLTTNAAPKQASLQTTSRPHHHATPQAKNYCM
jgi:hypothetical protein